MHHFPETVFFVYQRKSALAVCHESQMTLVRLPPISYSRMRRNWGPFIRVNHGRQKHNEESCNMEQVGFRIHTTSTRPDDSVLGLCRRLTLAQLHHPCLSGGSTPLGRLFFGLDMVREGMWYPFWHPWASSSPQTWSHFGRTQWDCCWLLGARRLGAHWGWGKEEYWVPRGGTNMVSERKTSTEERGEHLFLETSGHGCELCLRGSQHVY